MTVEIVCDDVGHWAETTEPLGAHALLADAPYELNFMGSSTNGWDNTGIAFAPSTWTALARHLLPGAFLMVFASTRGYHRLACALEDAGLIIHPSIFGYTYGSGWPKSTRIDDERFNGHRYGRQALKPAIEPIILSSKPDICYNELQEVTIDIALLLEDLWIRFADSADAITQAESIVVTALSNAETIIRNSEASTIASAVEKNLTDASQKSKKAEVPTAQKNVKMPRQANGLPARNAEYSPTKSPLLSPEPKATTTVAQTAILPTENCCAPVPVDTVTSPSLFPAHIEAIPIVQISAPVPHEKSQPSSIPCETGTDITIRAAMLRYNSERAKLDLSTIWLWRLIWADLCAVANTSTIETKLNLITQLRTLNYSLRRLMHASRGTVSVTSSSDKLWSFASDVNKHFFGLSTSLTEPEPTARPASLNPILTAQKPYEGGAVASIVQYGAGALNIDAARVAGESWGSRPAIKITSKGKPGGGYGQTSWEPIPGEIRSDPGTGRWPPNLCLIHLDACQLAGTQMVRTSGPPSGPMAGKIGGHGGIFVAPDGHREQVRSYADPDGMEQIMQWACAEGCPVAALDRQAGIHNAGGAKDCRGQEHGYMGGRNSTRTQMYDSYQDTGPVSRFFPQHGWADEIAERLAGVMPAYYCGKASASERAAGLPGRNPHCTIKPLSLCRWLASLLLPPVAYAPRRLLIPFAGVFSEVVGALHAGFEEIVAVEREAAYVEVGRKRLAYWTGQRGMAPEAAPPLATDTTIHTGEQLSLY